MMRRKKGRNIPKRVREDKWRWIKGPLERNSLKSQKRTKNKITNKKSTKKIRVW